MDVNTGRSVGRSAAGDAGAVADVMRVLCDETRLRLLMLLGGGESNVSSLVERTGFDQPAVSHHLAILRRAGMVRARRVVPHVYYRLAEAPPATNLIRVAAGSGSVTVSPR